METDTDMDIRRSYGLLSTIHLLVGLEIGAM